MHTATFDETVREVSYEAGRAAHRAIEQGKHAAEDLKDRTALRVRSHPLESIAWMFAAGAIVGCMFGYALGRPGGKAAGR